MFVFSLPQLLTKLRSDSLLPLTLREKLLSATVEMMHFNPNCHGLENVQTAMGRASEAPPKKMPKRM